MAAADDLEGISNYLYLHYPSFAASTIHRLYDAAKSLRICIKTEFKWGG